MPPAAIHFLKEVWLQGLLRAAGAPDTPGAPGTPGTPGTPGAAGARPSVHIDKFSGWDLFALIFGAVLVGLNTLLVLYAVYWRKYPPLRAKNIKLIVALYVPMTLWYFGTIGTNLNIRLLVFKDSCIVFASWLRVLLGTFLYIHVHILRLYLYIRIFTKMKRITIWCYVVPTVIYLAIIFGFGIPTTVLKNSLSIEYLPVLGVCTYGTAFKEMTFAIIWLGWFGVLLATFLARHINTSFNEFREMLAVTIISSVVIIYISVVHHIVNNYIIFTWVRVTTTVLEHIASQSSLFILLGAPIYNCMFHHDEYKRRFYEKLHLEGMGFRYNLAMERMSVSTTVAAQPEAKVLPK
ncbi:hypothetical protein GQ54DRAFT_335451 [Martensiomyces pterosporus]|nr:hypothetical protein GQ54DRAFT_335451 [Martensiomyces pterosporus]